jgi:Fructose-2,6-bisphosphatase
VNGGGGKTGGNEKLFAAAPQNVTRLVLIRHGRTAANQQGRMVGVADVPLDDEGRRQAQLLARKVLGWYKPQILYASPLQRAKQTAEIIAAPAGLPVVIERDLTEYDFGELSDLTWAELALQNPQLFAKLSAWLSAERPADMPRPAIRGAETLTSLEARIRRFAAMVVTHHRGGVVAAVAHGALIRAMLTLWAGGSLAARWAFRTDNASVSVVDFLQGVPQIRLFNDSCHLDMKLGYSKPIGL